MAFTDVIIAQLLRKTKSTPVLIDNSDITYPNDYTIQLDAEGTAHETVGDVFIFQYAHDKGNGNDPVTVSVNGSTGRRIKIQNTLGALRDMSLQDIVRYNIYIIYRAGSFWHYIGGTRVDVPGAFALWTDVPTLVTSLQDGDRFLIGDASAQGQNRVVAYQTLRDLIRIAVTEDGSTIVADPSFIDFRGGIDDVTASGAGVRVDVTEFIKELDAAPAAADMGDTELVVVRDLNNKASKAYIKSSRPDPFFAVTAADLGDGHIGYAATGYDSLDDNYAVNQGGTTGYSSIGAVSEQLFNLVRTSFTRVGTYTKTQSEGLAAYAGELWYLQDTGSHVVIRSFNPDTGVNNHSSGANASSGSNRGFTILNGIGYFFRIGTKQFRSYNIASTTFSTLSGVHGSITEVVGMANANGNVYTIYRNSSHEYFVAELDTSDGSLSTGQRLTGYESDDDETNTEGFAAVNDVLYMSTQDLGAGHNPHLYSVDPSNGDLTTVGDISPDNLDIFHLAQLGDYLYGRHSNLGIYRAEILMGNRWVVIFPSTTTAVGDDDLVLHLYPEPDGDVVRLARDSGITDAIVFASGLDGEDSHTIASGDSEEIAIYKEDGTPLFTGSNEAILNEVFIGRPTTTARGQLIAETGDLPTTATDDTINATWTLDAEAPSSFRVSGNYVYTPQIKPTTQIMGFECVAFLDGVEVDSVNVAWGPAALSEDANADEFSIGSLTFRGSQKIDVYYEQEEDPDLTPRLYLKGDNDALPSDATVKIYLWGVFVGFEPDQRIGQSA